MPKISELNAIVNPLDKDLIAVAHDIDGLPSTKKITFGNFANSIAQNYSTAFKLNVLPTSNTNEGYILTWDDVSNTATWQAFTGIEAYTEVDTANTYTATKHDYNIYASPNSISDNIRIILPDTTSNPPAIAGKVYTVKNIDSGYTVTVTTKAGQDIGSNVIEDPITGAFVISYDLTEKGSGDSWLFDGTSYRHIATQRAVPVFYTSVDTYAQVAIKNASDANTASSDLVLYNNIADINSEAGPYIDLGINSTTYNVAAYSIGGPSDSYLYNRGGDLAIGTGNTGTSVILHAGGTTDDKKRITVSEDGVYVNATMTFINTTPSASPEISSIYSDTDLLLKSGTYVSIKSKVKIIAPVPGSSIGSANDVAGSIAFDSNYMYYCTGTYNGVSNIWKRVAWSANTW